MRLASIWLPVIIAAIVSILCHFASREIGADYNLKTGGAAVPGLSRLYYPDALAIYFYPVLLGLWAIYGTIKKLSQEHALLLTTVTLSSTILFTVGWICGMVLPYISILVRPLSE